jgi:prevent-host-death family protein
MTTTIAQRELRNRSGEILRRAEAGERFVITVHGRPVAELGPTSRQTWVRAEVVREVLSSPTDPGLLDDLAAATADEPDDPWER